MKVNANIPPFQALVRNEFLFNQESGHGKYTYCWVHAVRSIKGQALQFYALLEDGALFTGLPIHAFTTKESAPNWGLGTHQFWDNLSYEIDVIEQTFLRNMDCTVVLKTKEKIAGTYMFSIDYVGEGLAQTPNEWKSAHIIQLENGNIVGYPPNRLIFQDASIVDKSANPFKKGYKVNNIKWLCEDNEVFTAGEDDKYFYGAVDKPKNKE